MLRVQTPKSYLEALHRPLQHNLRQGRLHAPIFVSPSRIMRMQLDTINDIRTKETPAYQHKSWSSMLTERILSEALGADTPRDLQREHPGWSLRTMVTSHPTIPKVVICSLVATVPGCNSFEDQKLFMTPNLLRSMADGQADVFAVGDLPPAFKGVGTSPCARYRLLDWDGKSDAEFEAKQSDHLAIVVMKPWAYRSFFI